MIVRKQTKPSKTHPLYLALGGKERCLSGETHINYWAHDEDGNAINYKGGSIRKLYERFHNYPYNGRGCAPERKEAAFFTAPSVNEDGRIFHNRIVDVVSTGVQECFLVTTRSGLRIEATREHKFLSRVGYLPLRMLKAGDTIKIHNATPFKVHKKAKRGKRAELYVKYHPVAGIKSVLSDGVVYTYHRLKRSRAVIEADMNGMNLEEFVTTLNSGMEYCRNLVFLPKKVQVHHRDENTLNDSIDNLEVLSREEHSREHALERHNNLRFIVVDDVIESISFAGIRETFDLKMMGPHNNYVAAGFVVHNSGKTTAAQFIINEYGGSKFAFADSLKGQLYDLNAIRGSELDEFLKYATSKGYDFDFHGLPKANLNNPRREDKVAWINRNKEDFRLLMQIYGDYKRDQDPDYFINKTVAAIQQAISDGAFVVVVDDVRFYNEVHALEKLGFQTVRINSSDEARKARGASDNSNHASETQLDSFYHSFVVHNNLEVHDLHAQLKDVVIGVLNASE